MSDTPDPLDLGAARILAAIERLDPGFRPELEPALGFDPDSISHPEEDAAAP